MQPVDYFSQMQATEGWRNILASFTRFVQPHGRTLDVGCGPGALVDLFAAHAHAFGVDYDPAMAVAARQKYGHPLTVGALPILPFMTGAFDVVTATNVVYLQDDPLSALREMARICKTGGIVAMLNPSERMNAQAAAQLAEERGLTGFARDNFMEWGTVAEANHRWTVDNLRELYDAAGLQLLETQDRIGDGLARYAKGTKT